MRRTLSYIIVTARERLLVVSLGTAATGGIAGQRVLPLMATVSATVEEERCAKEVLIAAGFTTAGGPGRTGANIDGVHVFFV